MIEKGAPMFSPHSLARSKESAEADIRDCGRTKPERWSLLALGSGVLLSLAPLLPYDRADGRTVSEISTFVWPNGFLLFGLGIVITMAAAAHRWARGAQWRRFAAGVTAVPAVTAATIHSVQLVHLHYDRGLRLAALQVGGWLIAAGCVGCVAAAIAGSTFRRSDRTAASLAGPPTFGTALAALGIAGGLLLEWMIAPLAVTGAGFVPYGAKVPVSDVYGAFAYISVGAIPPQAVAGFGLALAVTLAVLACGLRGGQAAGVVAGAAITAGLDTAARLVEWADPAHAIEVRALPMLSTAVTAVAFAAIAPLLAKGGFPLSPASREPQ
jgi:hypothetical protein